MRDFDDIGTAHHFGSSLVEADSLMPILVCLQLELQIVNTTDFCDFVFSHSLGRKRQLVSNLVTWI